MSKQQDEALEKEGTPHIIKKSRAVGWMAAHDIGRRHQTGGIVVRPAIERRVPGRIQPAAVALGIPLRQSDQAHTHRQ